MLYADFNFRLFERVATSETVSPLSLTTPTPGHPCPYKEARLQTFQNAAGTCLIASAAASMAIGWSEPVCGRELHAVKVQCLSRRTAKAVCNNTRNFGWTGWMSKQPCNKMQRPRNLGL
jgi:hypothetical protein